MVESSCSSHPGARKRRPNLALPAVRILIGSYFLASAGLIEHTQSVAFLTPVLTESRAEILCTTVLYVTASAIMLGRFVREAALLLAIFIFWPSFSANVLSPGADHLANFWRDMALLGAVVMIAQIQPRGTRPMRLPFTARRRPRRINVAETAYRRRMRPETTLEETDNIFAEIETA